VRLIHQLGDRGDQGPRAGLRIGLLIGRAEHTRQLGHTPLGPVTITPLILFNFRFGGTRFNPAVVNPPLIAN
jgi:hypothetical protein